MAKGKGKKGTPGLRAALANASKLGRQMNKEAMADYRVAMSAGAAGTANLRNQLGRIERAAGMAIRTDDVNIRSIGREARGVARAARAREHATVRQYGSALGQSVSNAYAGANTSAAGTRAMLRAQVKQGSEQTRVGTTVAQMAQTAAGAQGEAANYAFAQALQQRNIVSAETVAQLQGDLYKTALSAELEFQNFKRQQDYLKKLQDDEEKKNGNAALKGLDRVTDEVPGVLWEVGYAMREAEESGAEFNIREAAQAQLEKYGIPVVNPDGTESAQFQVLVASLGKMKRDSALGAEEAFNGALGTLYSGTPGFNKWSDRYYASAASNIKASVYQGYLTYAKQEELGQFKSDDGGSGSVLGRSLVVPGKGGVPG